MKKLPMLLAGLSLFGSAQATVYQFDFTAKIQEMVEFSPMTFDGGPVASSSLSGSTVSVGDIISGHFSYDTETAMFSNKGGSVMYSAPAALNTLGASIGGNNIALSDANYSSTNVQVANNAAALGGADSFGIANVSANAYASEMMALSFFDKSGLALNAATMPGQLDFASFNRSTFYYTYSSNATHAMMGANGALTSVTFTEVPTPVPEPETYAMLLAGLAAIGWKGRRR
ncbi:PEP-CTERM sorting domain-containing protein [Duganella sp. BJB488]|uniref:PEP-CTERM sorting domain-containing protein n=1 Tax=unclassified Duganella TaxID=2636909 RepID=UPI000E345063|nr:MULTISPECIES: PEP-CTERM sorting domain-containing protein [unclassified Duganella]RFP21517.1 PEP-CTERM sorting domain-containing protein [Duganella sp. BJB489]RFP23310.1 PEP-CTERM sorting domain-containing protein [Duganella sp. BJB488]RFP38476.1 PEP-CTERM sorting domain-containing protein [Duganella sp. BJB480]